MHTHTHRCRLPVATAIALVWAIALGACAVHAAGVAVIKEWDYHRDSTAKPIAYLQIIESPGPHVRLVTRNGNVDILRSKLVDRIDLPDSVPPDLTTETEVAPLREALESMKAFSTRYPLSTPLLESRVDTVAAHLHRFDGGEIRIDGKWIPRGQLQALRESREREAELRRRREVEEVIFQQSQRDKGLVEVDGKWVPAEEAQQRPATAATALSGSIWPLANPTIESARLAMEKLEELAATQKGAAKVRTERLYTAIRNLFLAEFRLTRQLIANTAAEAEAAKHDRHAREWMKPNSFGTQRKEAARESRAKAAAIRKRAAADLQASRDNLLAQLREADIVTSDFHKLREYRVALILGETVRAIAARRFPGGDFKPVFPEESLAAIREEIATNSGHSVSQESPGSPRSDNN